LIDFSQFFSENRMHFLISLRQFSKFAEQIEGEKTGGEAPRRERVRTPVCNELKPV
jgi:hypothetical protein